MVDRRGGWTCPLFSASILVLFLASAPAFAQLNPTVEVGVRAGVPLMEPLRSNICCSATAFITRDEIGNTPYAAGAMAGVTLYDRVRVEFGAVYMPVEFTFFSTTCCPIANPSRPTHGASWEFPLIADFSWLRGSLRPFTGGGIVLGNTLTGGYGQSPAPVFNWGVDWRRGRTSIRPEFRFIHYPRGGERDGIGRASRQLEFLLGFSLRVR